MELGTFKERETHRNGENKLASDGAARTGSVGRKGEGGAMSFREGFRDRMRNRM